MFRYLGLNFCSKYTNSTVQDVPDIDDNPESGDRLSEKLTKSVKIISNSQYSTMSTLDSRLMSIFGTPFLGP